MFGFFKQEKLPDGMVAVSVKELEQLNKKSRQTRRIATK